MVLTAGGPIAAIIVNGLASRVDSIAVIEEQPQADQFWRRCTGLFGWAEALGQGACGLVLAALAGRRRARQRQIWRSHQLDPRPDPDIAVHRVSSINSEECRRILRVLDPAVVAVHGTRAPDGTTLRAVDAPFIIYFAGTSPRYLGQHAAYWALTSGDPENAGVTIQLAGGGADGLAVLYQERVWFTPDDNISTYQHVQAAFALPLLARAIDDALASRLAPHPVDGPSQERFLPTLGAYLSTGLKRGVW